MLQIKKKTSPRCGSLAKSMRKKNETVGYIIQFLILTLSFFAYPFVQGYVNEISSQFFLSREKSMNKILNLLCIEQLCLV